MTDNWGMKTLVLFSTLLLTGCLFGGGSGGGPAATVSRVAWSSFYAKAAADLPSCIAERQDQIWYVEATKLFQHCDNYIWKKIDYRTKPTEILLCNKFISYNNGSNYERVLLKYEAVTYNTNEVRVSCRANVDERNDFNSETSSSGGSNPSPFEYDCEVYGDLDLNHPPSGAYDKGGRWQISRANNIVSVRYVDMGHPLTMTTWAFSNSECNSKYVVQ